jgi:nucleoside-diphosphate-sugar epimerase
MADAGAAAGAALDWRRPGSAGRPRLGGPPNTYVSSVHVADGSAAVAAALTVPAGTYNIVDDEPLTKRAYADALAAAAGKRVCLRIPGRLALLLGDRSTSLTRSLRVSNARFREASGWAPTYPSAREGWIATAKALEQVSRGNPIPE